MFLKKIFIRFRTHLAIKKNNTLRENISFDQSKTAGIVYSWEGDRKEEIINNFKKELELSGKKVKIICYKSDEINRSSRKNYFFNEEDFSNYGNIKSSLPSRFIQIKLDFLFHLDTTQNIFIEYLLAYSKARCRVSRVDYTKKDLYEFMIKTKNGEGLEQLCNQILHYTKSITSHAKQI